MTASYDYHIGVDYHKSYSHLVVQDSSGNTLRSGRVKNDRQSLCGFLERYRENSHAVVEATRNWMVIYDWLDDICDDVVLAHPLKVKAIADAKIKTDKIDATVLAHLLRADLVPEAWAPGERARELRIALRERTFYVRLRRMTKNRIVTVFDRYPEQTAQLKKLGDLFGKAGHAQLAQVNVSEIDRIQIDRGLAFIGDINVRIRQSEETIQAMTRANGNVKLLKTIPGIGEFFARLIDAEIDDIARFRTPKKLAAYAGLVPSTYSSGDKTWRRQDHQAGQQVATLGFCRSRRPCHRQRSAAARSIRTPEDQRSEQGARGHRAQALTIAFQILHDQRTYEPRGTTTEGASTISRLS
ncbi:transposase [Phyllobacterium trifolii]|uniref:Transposase n=1 Tax=Phyllobacterium trifolii TaxID=300193 RepID=A0A839UIZ9_9HYPH|nr:transposase [Phyllobacterium trifolii]